MLGSSDGTDYLIEVQELLSKYEVDPAAVSDEKLAALRHKARAAIDRLDDEPEFDEAHATLDKVGQLIRNERSGLCFLRENGDDFVQECPVALGHIRLGFSVGAEILESHCSICEGGPWECPHIPGDSYAGSVAVRVITRANLFEVSLVSRPDFPDARITSRPVSRAEVETAWGRTLPAGAIPVCDRCLHPCPGV